MRRAYLFASTCVAAILVSSPAGAAKPASATVSSRADTSPAAELVDAALQAEAAGQLESRDSLLEQAIQADPNCAAAHWHLGEILLDGKWLNIEAATKQATAAGKTFEYNNRRAVTGDTPAEQLALADWCRQQGLKEQHRAHALRALSANPEMSEARRALELYPVNGRWLTESEIIAERRQSEQEKKAVATWLPRLKGWLRTASSSERTHNQIREISDSGAVPAIEHLLSTRNNRSALLAVAAISNIPGQEATTSLVRHAVLSPWEDVRQTAAEELQKRSLYSYAPLLLAGMEFPIEVEYAGIEQGIGSWCYRCQWFREGPMADTAFDAVFRSQRNNDRVDGLEMQIAFAESLGDQTYRLRMETAQTTNVRNGLSNSARDETVMSEVVASVNERAQFINSRIGAALTVATDNLDAAQNRIDDKTKAKKRTSRVDNPTSPREWWNWWYDYNDIYYTNSRPVSTQQSYSRQVQPLVVRVDCFVAGTLVWTRTGPLAIELAKPGDLVLAQHPETGELAYKPVLAATVRPPVNLLKIVTGDDALVVTKGHPLWISGKCWRMARELAVGDQLHTATGTIAVTAIEPGPRAEAYSLVVDEFNTYFVGQSKILGHDNNLRQPTDSVVPGLVAQH